VPSAQQRAQSLCEAAACSCYDGKLDSLRRSITCVAASRLFLKTVVAEYIWRNSASRGSRRELAHAAGLTSSIREEERAFGKRGMDVDGPFSRASVGRIREA